MAVAGEGSRAGSAGSAAPTERRKRRRSASKSASRERDSASTAAPRSASNREDEGSGASEGSSVPSSSRPRSPPQAAERKRRRSPGATKPAVAPAAQRLRAVKFQHRRTSGEVWRCKKGKRSDIKPSEWGKFSYAGRDEVLTRPIVYDEQTRPIRRIRRSDITPEWFLENVAATNQPIIVEGGCSDWPAMHRWSIDAMEERFRHVPFKVAKDDKGKKLRMKFKYYADYLRHQQDDSPLYLFETNMDDNSYIRPLMDDYQVPDIFPHDWFALLNQDSRPPYRWFCIGPKRSGTTVHIDPLGTSAWNAVTHGVKHWVLFHPKESRRVVKGKDVMKKGEDDEAIMYFDFVLPRIKRAHPELTVYEGLQNPGDIIFVPGDWWHGVLNREDCVAVTQNYCGPDNFDLVWQKTRKEREKVAYLWLRNMRRFAPKLHDRAVAMNKRDKFKMRHERGVGEKLSSCSSSSSESSSDSSTDDCPDLDAAGLQAALGSDPIPLGAAAFRLQGPGASTTRRATAAGERSVNSEDGHCGRRGREGRDGRGGACAAEGHDGRAGSGERGRKRRKEP